MSAQGKKRVWWHTRFGVIGVTTQSYWTGRAGASERPFVAAAGVACRAYSRPLQRIITDFGADGAFGRVVEKVREHYGIAVSASAVRAITERHGAAMQVAPEVVTPMPAGGVRVLVAETDGSMVPIVEVEAGQGDGRRRRRVKWQEARLCLAGVAGAATRRYGATMGSVAQAGAMWRRVAVEAGAGGRTHLHCVGDGASWIVAQVKEQFGAQASYLVDFYHVSEYLADAATRIAGAGNRAWLHTQQARLKENAVGTVLAELGQHGEAESVAAEEAVVRRCAQYLANRRAHLDYAGALAAGLPIGSGEIESGHRTVIQSRLKLSGAWWTIENAEKMLALRLSRANGEWESYWQQQRQAQA